MGRAELDLPQNSRGQTPIGLSADRWEGTSTFCSEGEEAMEDFRVGDRVAVKDLGRFSLREKDLLRHRAGTVTSVIYTGFQASCCQYCVTFDARQTGGKPYRHILFAHDLVRAEDQA